MGRTTKERQGIQADLLFAVRVWRDGGQTDGSILKLSCRCDRTYTVCTRSATAPDGTGGVQLGTRMTPERRRSEGRTDPPPDTGQGVIGLGYFDKCGAFILYDANEARLI